MRVREWRALGLAVAAAGLLLQPATAMGRGGPAPAPARQAGAPLLEVVVESANGPHRFRVEVARTAEAQERGLMYRTNIPADGGMLFAPYSAATGGPRQASFWMKNTPSALDILFLRADGTIESIAADVPPYSETPVRSQGVVSAVLEINAGRAAALGIAPGDRVRWKGGPR